MRTIAFCVMSLFISASSMAESIEPTRSVSVERECFDLKDGEIYPVSSSVNVCFKTNIMKPVVYFDRNNLSLYEINTETAFPDHSYSAYHAFSLTSYDDYFISRQGDIVVVIDQKTALEPLIEGYNAGNVAGSAIGAVLTGADPTSAVIGTVVGIGAGIVTTAVTTPVIGPVGGAIAGSTVGGIVTTVVSSAVSNANLKPTGGIGSGISSHGSMGGSGGCTGCHGRS